MKSRGFRAYRCRPTNSDSHSDSHQPQNGPILAIRSTVHGHRASDHNARSLTRHSRLAKQSFHAPDCFPRRIRQDVAVRVHRQADLGMSEKLHDDARMHPLSEQEAGAPVAQRVELDTAQAGRCNDPLEAFIEGARLKRGSDPRREDQPAIVPSRTGRKPFLKLAPAMIRPQGRREWERYGETGGSWVR